MTINTSSSFCSATDPSIVCIKNRLSYPSRFLILNSSVVIYITIFIIVIVVMTWYISTFLFPIWFIIANSAISFLSLSLGQIFIDNTLFLNHTACFRRQSIKTLHCSMIFCITIPASKSLKIASLDFCSLFPIRDVQSKLVSVIAVFFEILLQMSTV